jgi:hypothetical protein
VKIGKCETKTVSAAASKFGFRFPSDFEFGISDFPLNLPVVQNTERRASNSEDAGESPAGEASFRKSEYRNPKSEINLNLECGDVRSKRRNEMESWIVLYCPQSTFL